MPEETIEEVTEDQAEETTEDEGEVTPQETTEESEETKEQSEVIPVRSNASYIIQRQKEKIARLEAEKGEDKDPVVERLDRIEELTLGQVEDRELNDFFTKQPEARKFEKTIRAYMDHDAYKASSPEVIYHHVAWDQAQSQADSKRKAADLEAGQTKTAGSSVRDTRRSDKKTADDIRNMTDAEFREYDQEQQRLARN